MSIARTTVVICFALIHCWTANEAMAQGSGDIRLVGGSTDNEGRVEIYYSGEWGTVCDNRWSFDDAQVVCRQLGYSGTVAYKRSAYFGQGNGKIWMDEVGCTGSESALSSCRFDDWGMHSCDHSEDAGVVCCTRPSYGRSCHMRCGANLTATGGTIFSPGFDVNGRYERFEDCDWYITPQKENSSVIIEFRSFATDFAYLTIYADPPTYPTSVARYSGYQLPYGKLVEGPLRLHFTSYWFPGGKGFSLYYTIVEGIAPRFLSVASDRNVMKGGEVVLPCHVTGIPQPVVTWYKDGLEVHSVLKSNFTLKGNDLIIEDIEEEDFGVFKCKAENYLNATEQVFRLFVYVPPVITTHPTPIHFENIFGDGHGYGYYGDTYFRLRNQLSAVFRCDILGSPRPNVYWKKNGIYVSNPTTKIDWLVIIKVSLSDAGNYSCFANNSYGSAESRTASLTIGNVLPCCSLYLRVYVDYFQRVGSSTRIHILFHYYSYAVSNVTVTKDGYHHQPIYTPSFPENYLSINLGETAVNDTGVYGYFLNLSSSSNSTVLLNPTVSFYVPLLVEVPLHVSLRPSNVILRVINERLHISCSVYHSLQSNPTISWSKNNMPVESENTIKGTGLTTAYLSVNNTPDVLSHYTCEAVNVVGFTDRATVSVVLRVEEGGWSWWMGTLPCSVTCGVTEGIRVRSRRCYNESSRCPGDSMQRTTCYSSLLYCPSERNVIRTSPTTMSERNMSTSQTTMLERNITDTYPRSMPGSGSKITVTERTQKQTAEGDLSRGQVAGLSVSLTATVAVALSAVLLWYVTRRLRQKSRDADATTDARTATVANSYIAPPFRKQQTDESNSYFRDKDKPNPSPSVRYSSACESECPNMQTDDEMAENPAYFEVAVVNVQQGRPIEEPVYAETCY